MKLFEVAEVRQDGSLCRGGIKASRATAYRWMKHNNAMHPDEVYIIVEADEEAITLEEYKRECKEYAEGST